MTMWEIAEKYMEQDTEIFAINKSTPVQSVRENVEMYLGKHVKVSTTSAKEILRELEAYGYKWVEHKPTGIVFMAGNPNHFLTAVASIIEL